jgi:hypothetical protein
LASLDIRPRDEALMIFEDRDTDAVEDLDPHRTVTYLENGVPHCYLGHPDCYDTHSSERRTDEVDWEEDADDLCMDVLH